MREIFKQSLWLFLAQASARAIGFFYTLFIAKSLSVSDFGLYSLALSYFSIIGAVSEFGLNRFLIREVALEKQNLFSLVFNVAFLRLVLNLLAVIIIGIAIFLFDQDRARNIIILLVMFATIPQVLSLTIDAIFVGLRKLALSSVSIFLMSSVTALTGVFLIERGFGILGVTYALILGQIAYLIFLTFLLLQKKIIFFRKIDPDLRMVNQVFMGSMPYGILAILALLYFRLDILLLTYLRGNFEAGLYGVAYRFLDIVIFIPSALSAAIFPQFVKLHGNPGEIAKLYFKSIKIMALMGLAICLAFILVLPEIFKTFLPNYFRSIEIIKILSLSIPFMFIHIPGAQVLLSTDKFLKTVILLSLVTLSFNLILNLLFIPIYGMVAAAWITVFSEILSLILFYILLRIKILKI